MNHWKKFALVTVLRPHNESTMARMHIPVELWDDVWKFLAVDDRFNFSHVCHAWLELALASHRMWSSLQFSSRYKRYRNITTIRQLLERTGTVIPLTLEMEVSEDRDSLEALANALRPYLSRIVSLSILSEYHSEVPWFLSLLSELPGLRDFYTSGPEKPPRNIPHSADFWMITKLVAPTLERAALLGYHVDDFPSSSAPVVTPSQYLPALQQLQTTFRSARELAQYLQYCPALSSLHVDVQSRELNGPTADWTLVRGAVAKLDSLRVSGVSQDAEVAVEQMFSSTDRRELVIDFTTDTLLPAWASRIFACLSGPLTLSVLRTPREGISIAAADATGLRRELTRAYQRTPVEIIFRDMLRTSSVTALDVDSQWWKEYLPQIPTDEVRELTLRVGFSWDISAVLSQPASPAIQTAFPKLEMFRLVSSKLRVSVTVASLFKLLNLVLHGGRVDVLRLDNVVTDGDVRMLGPVAGTLVRNGRSQGLSCA